MKNWFLSLGERDRKIVVALGLIVSFVMLYAFLWMPLLKENAQLEQRVQSSQSDLEWMQQATQKIKTSGPLSKSKAERKLSSGSFLTLIEKTAATANIKLEKIVPKKDKQVEIRLKSVSFNQVISWIELLTRKHGVVASKFSAEKVSIGKVNLVVLLEG
ncbi:MAG: type II secretion system protein M [Pseudomonadales bacterium]|nr:type II secretion system protein M [Pseudomonadales bacterium]